MYLDLYSCMSVCLCWEAGDVLDAVGYMYEVLMIVQLGHRWWILEVCFRMADGVQSLATMRYYVCGGSVSCIYCTLCTHARLLHSIICT